MRTQATKATRQQINHHILRQRDGLKSDFSHMHPIADAIIGSLTLALFFGGMFATAIYQGANL